jgi:hypothetical protein
VEMKFPQAEIITISILIICFPKDHLEAKPGGISSSEHLNKRGLYTTRLQLVLTANIRSRTVAYLNTFDYLKGLFGNSLSP